MFTIQELISEVRSRAAGTPDVQVVIEGDGACYYTGGDYTDDCQGCIFGRAIIALAPEQEEFLKNTDERLRTIGSKGMPYGGMKGAAIETVLEDLEVEKTDDEITWCAIVQENQDMGMTWKQCVEQADEHVGAI